MNSSLSLSRRALVASLAGLGLGALSRRHPLLAQSGLQVRPHRIDVHHHLFPPEYRTAVAAANAGALVPWTVEQSLAEMDKSAIQTAMLSVSPPGIWFAGEAEGRKLARIINDYGARMRHDHPQRFGLFAALPLPDTEGSLREIEYAFDSLKADGIGLMTNYGEQWLGDAAFAPVWEELNRRKAVIYTHPNTPTCCTNIKDEVGPGTIEWATDTTRTTASLLFSGTAARYPDIRWILSHGGGTTPFLLSRFTRQEQDMKQKAAQVLPKGVLYELKKFYYDTAQANHPGALAALLKLAPVSQILFGTDYPYRTGAEEADGLAAQHFPASDLEAIERGNALRILPGLKA
jgi:predicted TIM-barrel fold metal-dependent hydrolase